MEPFHDPLGPGTPSKGKPPDPSDPQIDPVKIPAVLRATPKSSELTSPRNHARVAHALVPLAPKA